MATWRMHNEPNQNARIRSLFGKYSATKLPQSLFTAGRYGQPMRLDVLVPKK